MYLGYVIYRYTFSSAKKTKKQTNKKRNKESKSWALVEYIIYYVADRIRS